jgi:hypothetical protein
LDTFLDLESAPEARSKFEANKANKELLKAKLEGFNKLCEEHFNTQSTGHLLSSQRGPPFAPLS